MGKTEKPTSWQKRKKEIKHKWLYPFIYFKWLCERLSYRLQEQPESEVKFNQEQYELLKRCSDKKDMTEWNEWREKNKDEPIYLQCAELTGANLENANLEEANLEEAILKKANLQGSNLLETNFNLANLEEANLEKVDLAGASLSFANLDKANLTGANLLIANLTCASIKAVNLKNTYLLGTDFGLSNLIGTKFTGDDQFAADTLLVKNLTTTSRTLFLLMLTACFLCWLSLAQTTDKQLIMNEGTIRLPVVNVDTPTSGFYLVAPFLLFIIYIYFLTYVQRLWDSVLQLPFIFPDGVPFYKKIPPFVLTGLASQRLYAVAFFLFAIILAFTLVPFTTICLWLRYLTKHHKLGTFLQVVPVTLSLLACHKFFNVGRRTIKKFWAGRIPDTLIEAFLDEVPLERIINRSILLIAILLAFLCFISYSVIIDGQPYYHDPKFAIGQHTSRWPTNQIVLLLEMLHLTPFADLRDADLSERPPGLRLEKEEDFDLVKGARLQNRSLRCADARKAFLVNANLTNTSLWGARLDRSDLRRAVLGSLKYPYSSYKYFDSDTVDRLKGMSIKSYNFYIDLDHYSICKDFKSDPNKPIPTGKVKSARLRYAKLRWTRLEKAFMVGVDLTGAELRCAKLNGADLSLASLSQADLRYADLTDARLRKADLRGADLSYVKGLTREQINSAFIDVKTQLPDYLKK